MNNIEGISRTDKIYLYTFPGICGIYTVSDAECAVYLNDRGETKLFLAVKEKIDDSKLSANGGKYDGEYSSFKIFGTGMRGSSNILCRTMKIMEDNDIKYRVSSMCESGLVFIMDRESAIKMFECAKEEFKISLS